MVIIQILRLVMCVEFVDVWVAAVWKRLPLNLPYMPILFLEVEKKIASTLLDLLWMYKHLIVLDHDGAQAARRRR